MKQFSESFDVSGKKPFLFEKLYRRIIIQKEIRRRFGVIVGHIKEVLNTHKIDFIKELHL